MILVKCKSAGGNRVQKWKQVIIRMFKLRQYYRCPADYCCCFCFCYKTFLWFLCYFKQKM